MVNIEEFGIANFRLARKAMSSRKCQCKPKEPCPCSEWIEKGICHCGVFWDIEEKQKAELSKTERKIITALIGKLVLLLEDEHLAFPVRSEDVDINSQ